MVYGTLRTEAQNVAERPLEDNPRSGLPVYAHAPRPLIRCDCVGQARVLIGNANHVNPDDPREGGFRGERYRVFVRPGTAAIDPYQWQGDKGDLRPFIPYIRGINEKDNSVLFEGVTDVIGNSEWDPMFEDIREELRSENEGLLLIELPSGTRDRRGLRVRICLPAQWRCALGTSGNQLP